MPLTPMTMIPCPKGSTNVQEVGYSAEGSKLRIRFQNGGLYEYEDVPDDVYTDLLKAESVGGFIAKNVRGKFKATRIDEPKDPA